MFGYTGAPYHYDKDQNLPYDVRTMKRHGKYRRCVIQHIRSAGGHDTGTGRVIAMSV